jgi:hypothetical protein
MSEYGTRCDVFGFVLDETLDAADCPTYDEDWEKA